MGKRKMGMAFILVIYITPEISPIDHSEKVNEKKKIFKNLEGICSCLFLIVFLEDDCKQ